jgi:hypothetical protein
MAALAGGYGNIGYMGLALATFGPQAEQIDERRD